MKKNKSLYIIYFLGEGGCNENCNPTDYNKNYELTITSLPSQAYYYQFIITSILSLIYNYTPR